MDKIKIDSNDAFVYPMPMTLIGAVVDGRPNFLAAAWVSRVNFKPAMMMAALGAHHTNLGIDANGAFSINIPDVSLLEKTDYCGIVSGKKVDKSKLFDVFYGSLAGAPLIRECPLSMACRLNQTVKLPFDTLYIGDVVEVYTEERYLTGGKPDVKKINPFTLTMPDNHYWRVGELAGNAWSAGKKLKE
ncbi:MAG: flavodoxin [Proteobacteria bacterium]|nr:flavodoxin [Pseudomonadota bacterium]